MMERRGLWLGWLGLVFACVVSARAVAAPWDKILTMSRVDADPKKVYTLTEKNGPWMILACSFAAGEDEQGRQSARQQARELVLELRKRYKLPAYVFEKEFEFGKEVEGRGVDRFGHPVRMRYRRGSETSEVAVLVGDYSRADDPEAQETLKKLKHYQPDCLSLEKRPSTSRPLAALRVMQAMVLSDPNDDRKKRGPMGMAIITTNPILPADFFSVKGIDPTVLKANEGVEHCLLDCPGKYTVQVAHFTGKWIIKQREIDKEMATASTGKSLEDSPLAQGALKAHVMTQALRKHGFEAYEFHDRYASLVTVGSFDGVGPRDANGAVQMDPRIEAIINKFKGGGDQAQLMGGVPMLLPKTLRHFAPEVSNEQNIPFDMQPVLVEVPKRSISAALAPRSTDLRF